MFVALRSLETIGYAFSFDGFNFTKSVNNPVVRREATPGVSAMAESHACEMQTLSRFDRVRKRSFTNLFTVSDHEPPFVYVYHTTRW